jgi:hypothetical protein
VKSIIHQHLWNWLVITPTTTVDVDSFCVHVGVDDIDFVLKSRQHSPVTTLSAHLPVS